MSGGYVIGYLVAQSLKDESLADKELRHSQKKGVRGESQSKLFGHLWYELCLATGETVFFYLFF